MQIRNSISVFNRNRRLKILSVILTSNLSYSLKSVLEKITIRNVNATPLISKNSENRAPFHMVPGHVANNVVEDNH